MKNQLTKVLHEFKNPWLSEIQLRTKMQYLYSILDIKVVPIPELKETNKETKIFSSLGLQILPILGSNCILIQKH